jgi:hypothetical protein
MTVHNTSETRPVPSPVAASDSRSLSRGAPIISLIMQREARSVVGISLIFSILNITHIFRIGAREVTLPDRE